MGELNPTQLEAWQHSIDVLHEDGQRRQLRLFTDRDQSAPNDPDVVVVKLSSFAVRSPRRFGDGWAAAQPWEDLGLHAFWRDALAAETGDVPWGKVLELLVVNRLLAPRSELFVHEKWFPQSAMDVLLDTDARVADKDRLDRCRDPLLVHKARLRTTTGRQVARPFRRDFRSPALRSDQHLFRGRRGSRAQSPTRLLARSPARMQATRPGPGRHDQAGPFIGRPTRSKSNSAPALENGT